MGMVDVREAGGNEYQGVEKVVTTTGIRGATNQSTFQVYFNVNKGTTLHSFSYVSISGACVFQSLIRHSTGDYQYQMNFTGTYGVMKDILIYLTSLDTPLDKITNNGIGEGG